MRYINTSMHTKLCEQLKNIATVQSDLIDGRIINAAEMKVRVHEYVQKMEELYASYWIKIRELQQIAEEYHETQNQARVCLRRQQLKALPKTTPGLDKV
ncbi:hypothetical protein [uncultured Chitinophaga sp.]|jgi:hypothetical protein|uniref:hypothetical protein n=1 Tax=uncultured Chitinophaga sp. TaxID=339340 RepID=UPI00263242CB|nr:hypothetical protein [uncultured Chitinophaga sp.]